MEENRASKFDTHGWCSVTDGVPQSHIPVEVTDGDNRAFAYYDLDNNGWGDRGPIIDIKKDNEVIPFKHFIILYWRELQYPEEKQIEKKQ